MNVFKKDIKLEAKRIDSRAAKNRAAQQFLEDIRLSELVDLAQEAQAYIPSCTEETIDRGSPFEKAIDVVPDNPRVWLTLRFFDEDEGAVKAILKKSDFMAEGSYKLDDRRIHRDDDKFKKLATFFVNVWTITVPGNGGGPYDDHKVVLEFFRPAHADQPIGGNCRIVTIKKGIGGYEQSAILCEEEAPVPVP